jgi:hypothetical protein
MKRIAAIIAVIASIPFLTFGLLFLIAAMENPGRILIAGVLFAMGGVVLYWGIVTLRRLAEISPKALDTGAVALARRFGGEVTVAQVQAEYRIPASPALEALERLRSAGHAQVEQREGRAVYVLRGLQPSLVTRRCPYCGSTFPVRESRRKCPNCGAALEVQKD